MSDEKESRKRARSDEKEDLKKYDVKQHHDDWLAKCPICIDLIRRPVMAMCGHHCCESCVSELKECPMCRADTKGIWRRDYTLASVLAAAYPARAREIEFESKKEVDFGNEVDALVEEAKIQAAILREAQTCGVLDQLKTLVREYIKKGDSAFVFDGDQPGLRLPLSDVMRSACERLSALSKKTKIKFEITPRSQLEHPGDPRALESVRVHW
jgi:hypothetical protein